MLSIGITTFETRFEQYFVPLLQRIKAYAPEIEVIVAVNGENKQTFSEKYRAAMLFFLSDQRYVYPIFFPAFRGLAKLWNTITLHATNEHIFMLNDDVMINNANFVQDVEKAIQNNAGKMFYCNNSWSHYVINKTEADDIGYFDERLLGIGEEDGDFTWRYLTKYGVRIPNVDIEGLVNLTYETLLAYKPVNIRCHSGTRYSLFNRNFVYQEKFERNNDGLAGMFDYPVIEKGLCSPQYPNEKFYRLRKDEL